MPLTETGLQWVANARQLKPEEYQGLTNAEALAKIYERRVATDPTYDRQKFMTEAGIGENSLGVLSGFGKGLVDAINPTTYEPFDETLDDNAYGARTIGNIVGTLGTFMGGPTAALGLANKAKLGLRGTKLAATGLDWLGRAYLGGVSGARQADRTAEGYGMEEANPESRATLAAAGAASNMIPLGAGKSRILNALLGGTSGAIYSGGMAISEGDLNDRPTGESVSRALRDPLAYLLPGIGAAAGFTFPDKFGISKVGELMNARAGRQAARVVTPPDMGVGGSTITSGSVHQPASATAPTAQVPDMPISASLATLLKGLGPQQLFDAHPSLQGMRSGPAEQFVEAAKAQKLTRLARLLEMQQGTEEALQTKARGLERTVMQMPHPDFGITEPTPIGGYVGGRYVIGEDLENAPMISARALANRTQQMILDSEGKGMSLPEGWEMNPGAQTYPEVLSTDTMTKLGLSTPNVEIYGRKAFPVGTPAGQIPEGHIEAVIARALGEPDPIQLGMEDVPRYAQIQAASKKAREDAEASKALVRLMRSGNAIGAGDTRQVVRESANPDSQLERLLALIEENDPKMYMDLMRKLGQR